MASCSEALLLMYPPGLFQISFFFLSAIGSLYKCRYFSLIPCRASMLYFWLLIGIVENMKASCKNPIKNSFKGIFEWGPQDLAHITLWILTCRETITGWSAGVKKELIVLSVQHCKELLHTITFKEKESTMNALESQFLPLFFSFVLWIFCGTDWRLCLVSRSLSAS